MKPRVVLVHGWDGNPYDSWKPWLKNELERRSIQWIAPQFSGGESPELSKWIRTIKKEINEVNSKTYFIGHSLGCIAILRYLEQLPKNKKVGGCVFVAGFCSNLEPELDNFTSPFINIPNILKHTSRFVVIGSHDDDAVPFSKILELQKTFNARLVIDEGKGHFSEGDGIKELPSVLHALLEIIGEKNGT